MEGDTSTHYLVSVCGTSVGCTTVVVTWNLGRQGDKKLQAGPFREQLTSFWQASVWTSLFLQTLVEFLGKCLGLTVET